MSRTKPSTLHRRRALALQGRSIEWRNFQWYPTGKTGTDRHNGHPVAEYNRYYERRGDTLEARLWVDLATGEVEPD